MDIGEPSIFGSLFKMRFRFHIDGTDFPSSKTTKELKQKMESAFDYVREMRPNSKQIKVHLSSPDPQMTNSLPYDFVEFDEDAFEKYYVFLVIAHEGHPELMTSPDILDMDIFVKVSGVFIFHSIIYFPLTQEVFRLAPHRGAPVGARCAAGVFKSSVPGAVLGFEQFKTGCSVRCLPKQKVETLDPIMAPGLRRPQKPGHDSISGLPSIFLNPSLVNSYQKNTPLSRILI